MTAGISGGSVRRERPVPSFTDLAAAAHDRTPVSGWTHNFYRYPARFSPQFAATAIAQFSRPGDLILDPYMGGGTTVVEALAAGRHVVGNDLNSLATFVARVKVTPLSARERNAICMWTVRDIPGFTYRVPLSALADILDSTQTKNLALVKARFIKKATAAALLSISELPGGNAQHFARCIVLRACQWALDGRVRHTTLAAFREKLASTADEMLTAITLLAAQVRQGGGRAVLYNNDAASLPDMAFFKRRQADLVVTSPPYPGVHVLYHRWQVDGRRETPAPYWITGCNDGQGASFYNFGDRRQQASDRYFRASLRTLQAIRRVMKDGAYIIQLVAFNRPDEQLERYLANMSAAGFSEASPFAETRIWREVPNRKWHANLRGKTHSAKEVVLVHQALR